MNNPVCKATEAEAQPRLQSWGSQIPWSRV